MKKWLQRLKLLTDLSRYARYRRERGENVEDSSKNLLRVRIWSILLLLTFLLTDDYVQYHARIVNITVWI